MTFSVITPSYFSHLVETAMATDARVGEYLSHGVDYSAHECYATADGTAGFAIAPDGDLQSVFNVGQGGRGAALVTAAIAAGAVTLDCFDGFLPAFYARHGFVIVRREANWTEGGPDVVYMAR